MGELKNPFTRHKKKGSTWGWSFFFR